MGPLAIGALLQVPKILGGLFGGGKQKRAARKINPIDPTYSIPKYSREQLELARNAFMSRTPGAAVAEQNIMGNQANMLANINRNAGDGSQAIAAAAGIGGQTNQSFVELSQAEAQNTMQEQQMLNQSLQNMSAEERLVYQDKLRKYKEALQAKQELMRSGMVNQQNALNEIGNLGGLYASGLFGSGGGGQGGAGGGGVGSLTTGWTPEEMAADYTRRRGVLGVMPRLRF
jgi:hypothetical protein